MSGQEFAGAYERDGDIFVTYDDDSEAQLDPRLIRDAGYKPEDENDPCKEDHCGTDECTCDACSLEVTAVLEAWHNDTHAGVYRFCGESPCREMNDL